MGLNLKVKIHYYACTIFIFIKTINDFTPMKHFLLIIGLLCLISYTTSTAHASTLSFWQTIFPDVFTTSSVLPYTNSTNNFVSNCSVACIEADSLELVKLIDFTNIEIVDFTWNVNNPVCTWDGITIDNDGYVTVFDRKSLGISGILPPTFGQDGLSRMTEFKVSINNLTGTIPPSMGNLPALSVLWLDDNQFTGDLPTELGDDPNLSVFWVDNNQFTGAIPENFLDLDFLREISIYNNCFDSLPDFSSSTVTDINQTNSIVCYDNKFTFDDLAPNANFMNRNGQNLYSPQDTFDIPAAAALETGDTYSIDLGIDAGITDNIYRWTKDGAPFGPLLSVNKLNLSPITFADAGTYCCFVTNPQLPLLELVSTCQTITVSCGTSIGLRDDVVCAGGFININGTNYGDPSAGFPRTGTEDISDLDQYGCDSIVNIDLTIMGGMSVAFEPIICQDDTVFVNGTAYHFNNNEGTEIFSVSGCDSIVEVNLDFFPMTNNTIDGTFCRSDTIFVDGVAYYFGNENGNQVLENENFRGCDSLVTIDLNFHPSYEGNDNRELCSGQSVFINGTEYGESPLPQSGIERISGVAPNGCDSLVSVMVTISEGVIVERNDVLCPGQTVFINGTEYGESPLPQSGSEGLTLPNGCDSTILVNISFQNQITDNFVPFFCHDETIVINGTTYGNPALGHEQSGTEIILGVGGCDTLRSIFINIHPASEADINFVICEGEFVSFNGTNYNEGNLSGTEVISNADPNGCDSTYTVTVTVYTPEEANITPQICPGGEFDLNGKTFNAADPVGTVVIDDIGFNGCDSTVNVQLSFYDSLNGNFSQTICNNDNFIYNGTLYGDGGVDTGMEILSGVGANGCDSFIQVTVNYYPAVTGLHTIQLCPGESEVFDNTLYGSQDGGVDSGFETLEGEGFGGCDSTVNVTVIYFPDSSPGFYEERICQSDTLFFNGTAFHLNNTSGTENIGPLGANGCDSLVEVSVRFFPQVINREDPTLCSGTTITINGTVYGEAPMFPQSDSIVLENASVRGCDSTIIVDLSFNSFVENNIVGEFCGCEEIVIAGQTFDCNNPSDTISFEGGSFTGCDSIVNINLTYNETPVVDFVDTLCPGTTITIRGTVYGEALTTGTEIFPNATAAGCDSTVNIELFFYQEETRDISASICQGDSILVGDTYYKFPGTFDEVIPMATANGCDSILVLTLTVTEPEPVELDNLGEICDSANPINLPPPSGVNGNWSGLGVNGNTFDPSTLMGEVTLTFTPLDGCAEENSTTITISSFSSGSVTDSICPGEMLTISGIDITMPGSYRDTLEGATVTGCDSLVLIEILAKTPVAILLENIPSLCSSDNPITLNNIQDGVMGDWSGTGISGGNMFNPSTLSGIIELTFTPSEMGCFATTTTEVTVNDGGPITLESFPGLCELDDPISLDPIQVGITGTWSGDGVVGDTFDPNLLTGDIQLTFTPTDGGCVTANSTIIQITASEPVPLEPLGMVCGNNIVALSTTTSGGISGIWSGPGINPAGNEFDPDNLSGEITLTFTPNGNDCLTANTTTIIIGDFALKLINESICGVTGQTVTINDITYSMAGFFSDTLIGGSIAGCDSIINITITDATTEIILDPLPGLCSSGSIIDLPTVPSGIPGTWTGTGVIDGNSFDPTGLDGSFILGFIPEAGACATSVSTSIQVGDIARNTIVENICEGDSINNHS